jgi:hypothetical protein
MCHFKARQDKLSLCNNLAWTMGPAFSDILIVMWEQLFSSLFVSLLKEGVLSDVTPDLFYSPPSPFTQCLWRLR